MDDTIRRRKLPSYAKSAIFAALFALIAIFDTLVAVNTAHNGEADASIWFVVAGLNLLISASYLLSARKQASEEPTVEPEEHLNL